MRASRPDDGANRSYAEGYRGRLAAEPIKHRLRTGLFRLQCWRYGRQLTALNRQHSVACVNGMVGVPSELQPPPYRYGALRGPWIESYFFEHWLRTGARSSATYLPIFFDPFYFQAQSHKYTPFWFERTQRSMKETLANLDPCKPYFTVLGMYDFPIWDWHAFPRNVVVFSANGGGDLPIPLLPGSISIPTTGEHREIAVSFFGSLEGPSDFNNVRSRMHAALKDLAFFGRGPHWRDGMTRSTFSLCPRGLGRASFRLYEAMALGSIPIYIWDDREWLPFQDSLDWSEFSISLPIDAIDELPDRLASLSPERIRAMQRRLAEVVPAHFTMEATCRAIIERCDRIRTVADAEVITRRRVFS